MHVIFTYASKFIGIFYFFSIRVGTFCPCSYLIMSVGLLFVNNENNMCYPPHTHTRTHPDRLSMNRIVIFNCEITLLFAKRHFGNFPNAIANNIDFIRYKYIFISQSLLFGNIVRFLIMEDIIFIPICQNNHLFCRKTRYLSRFYLS